MVRFVEARLVVLLIGLAHLIMGVAVLAVPSAMWVTPLHAWAWVLRDLHLNGEAHLTIGMLLALTGGMAIVATSYLSLPLKTRIALLWPQQIVLIVQFVSVGSAILAGVYPDGYRPAGGRAFILADQSLSLLASVYHMVWLGYRTAGLLEEGQR